MQYACDGGHIWILPGAPEHKTWWRNLRDGAAVDLGPAGHEHHGHATVIGPGQPGFAKGLAAYRSVIIWNSSSAPRGSMLDVAEFVEQEEVKAAVAGDDAGQLSFVGGFDELVDELRGGDVADPAALLAGGQARAR